MTEDRAPYGTVTETVPHIDSPACDCPRCRDSRRDGDIAETQRRMRVQRDEELERVRERALDLGYAHLHYRHKGLEHVDWCSDSECWEIVATTQHQYLADAEHAALVDLRTHMEGEGEWPANQPAERPEAPDSGWVAQFNAAQKER